MSARRGTGARDPTTANAYESADAVRDRCIVDGEAVRATTSGYIQTINNAELLRSTKMPGTVACFMFEPGQFILEGEVLAYLLPTPKGDDLHKLILNAVKIGQHRSLEQDIDFAFAQLSEIAIRALSPAVNDTYTGLTRIDWLGDSMRMLTAFPEWDGASRAGDGSIRLLRPSIRIARISHTAFDLIREAGANSPSVMGRLLQTCARLAPHLRDVGQRQAILDLVEAARQSASHMPAVDMDREMIDAAYQLARARLGAPGHVA